MPRNLVVCCDGTANKFGAENTNVVRIIEVLKADDPDQLVFYDPGVGTLPGDMLRDKIRTAIDLAFATSLSQNVTEAYSWLMHNWREGDRIFVFGFSRGAYTARVVAALLHHIGLLPPHSEQLIPYALRLLRSARKDDSSLEVGNHFRRTFARPSGDPERRVKTHFAGVWDTVSAVGWIWDPVKYRYTATNPSVSVVRHAMAIDEHRAFFTQNRMSKAESSAQKYETAGANAASEPPGWVVRNTSTQDWKQLWFAGVHSDVGGGYPDTELWRCAFDWMVGEARNAGLLIDEVRLARVAPPLTQPAWTEGQHESLRKWWVAAEFFPKLHWNAKKRGNEMRFNFSRRRRLQDGELLHSSALERIRHKAGYAPPNLSKEFRQYVKSLAAVPDVLPYANQPVVAPIGGWTPQTP
jgi:uncharacterized protein (DUF2235 family)